MKFLRLLSPLTALMLVSPLAAQTIWNGPTLTFTKASNADWTLPENQDRITSGVWITRASTKGIFNIAAESGYVTTSPAGTEWAYGSTTSLSGLTFDTWEKTHNANPTSTIGKNMVMHLIAEDIYLDIKILSYASGGPGGGFSYERSSDPATGIREESAGVTLSPNPAATHLTTTGLTDNQAYSILSSQGSVLLQGILDASRQIDIRMLAAGLYSLRLGNGKVVRFVKA